MDNITEEQFESVRVMCNLIETNTESGKAIIPVLTADKDMIEFAGGSITLRHENRLIQVIGLASTTKVPTLHWIIEEAIPVPASRWEPESVDIGMVSIKTNLFAAVKSIFMRIEEWRIDSALEYYTESQIHKLNKTGG